MRILLDTHVALWLATTPERLSVTATALVHDSRHDLLVSAASAWEIAIKHAAGKLDLPDPPDVFLPELLRRLQLDVVPIELPHAVQAAALPPLHRDPFDRMLVAQAQLMSMAIMTIDSKITSYEVDAISA